ncbi:MAG TPA: glycosyltransferase family A protein, partial [Acidimicrobiales bacterium]
MTGTAGPSAPPQVSVVIPTHNRAGMVTETLRALGGQEDAPPFEVIVVDDASTDDTQDVLRLLADGFPVPLIALRQATNRGPATARNQGWRSARGDIVCFTDDDCVPQPGWLAALVDGLG